MTEWPNQRISQSLNAQLEKQEVLKMAVLHAFEAIQSLNNF